MLHTYTIILQYVARSKVMGGVIVSGRTSQIGAVIVSSRLIYQLNLCPQLTMANQGMPPAVVSSHPFQFKFLTASIKEWLAAEVVMSEKSSSRPLSHSERTAFHSCSTCTQVPRFSFQKKKISELEWGLNPHTHISGVMLYQPSLVPRCYSQLFNVVHGHRTDQGGGQG